LVPLPTLRLALEAKNGCYYLIQAFYSKPQHQCYGDAQSLLVSVVGQLVWAFSWCWTNFSNSDSSLSSKIFFSRSKHVKLHIIFRNKVGLKNNIDSHFFVLTKDVETIKT